MTIILFLGIVVCKIKNFATEQGSRFLAVLPDGRRTVRGRGWCGMREWPPVPLSSPATGKRAMPYAAIEAAAALPDGRCRARGRGWRLETIIKQSTGAPGCEPASVLPVW